MINWLSANNEKRYSPASRQWVGVSLQARRRSPRIELTLTW